MIASTHIPSRPVAVGTLAGAPAGTLIVWLLGIFGVEVPAEAAAALGSLLGGFVGFFTRGGQRR